MIVGGVVAVCMRSPRLENRGKTMVACGQCLLMYKLSIAICPILNMNMSTSIFHPLV